MCLQGGRELYKKKSLHIRRGVTRTSEGHMMYTAGAERMCTQWARGVHNGGWAKYMGWKANTCSFP